MLLKIHSRDLLLGFIQCFIGCASKNFSSREGYQAALPFKQGSQFEEQGNCFKQIHLEAENSIDFVSGLISKLVYAGVDVKEPLASLPTFIITKFIHHS